MFVFTMNTTDFCNKPIKTYNKLSYYQKILKTNIAIMIKVEMFK